MRRVKDWRLPENTVVVGRPGKWGNPFRAQDTGTQYPSLNDEQIAGMLVSHFRDLLRAGGSLHYPNWLFWGGQRGPRDVSYPSETEIRAELAGKSLACWCPLDRPCHADVLLEVANA